MTPTLARTRSWISALAVLLVFTMLAAACGGGGESEGGGTDAGAADTGSDVGEPTPGGKVVYGLEAETSGGFCLPEAQFAISGIQVARAIYEPLTLPNDKGEYVPYLAKSVTPNDDLTEWTIELREGVKFHDGSDLTAEVVKNNIDAFRGQYPARNPRLFRFVFEPISDVAVTGPLTLVVTTKMTWPAFPAYLYFNGRFGVMAQAQLDDPDHCHDELIGTGPFMLKEWKVNNHLLAVKNPDYWQEGLPYLDEIEFRPIPEGATRLNSLQGGEVNTIHTSNALGIADLRALAEQGDIALVESDEFAEVGYTMLNANKPPFDNLLARQAMAYAIDREETNQIRSKGLLTEASGPFAPGNLGYLADAGYPDFDLEKAKELVAQYERETGHPLKFIYTTAPAPESLESATLLREQLAKAGIQMELKTIEQSQMISIAIANNFEAIGWRNHPGGDPDSEYLWWYGGSPVNFGKFDDPEINRLLDEGRREVDRAKRDEIYQELNRRFASQVYNLWGHWALWAVATAPEVHGVMGPDLPDGSRPIPGFANGHSVTGLWIKQ